MSWRDQLRPGSFRGVPFEVESAELSGGRRVVTHQFPNRDVPYGEDLGRRARAFSVQCYVIGSDYMDRRDALIDALEASGAGTLIHPYYGRRRVNATEYRVTDSVKHGGMATFSIQFAEAGENDQPTETTDTAAKVEASAAALEAAAVAAFTDQYSTSGQPAWAVQGVVDTLGSLAEQLRTATDSLTVNISSPQSLAQSVIDAAAGLASEVGYSLLAFERASQIGIGITDFPFTTSVRQKQARNQRALIQLTRQATVVAASREAAVEDYPSQNDAAAVLEAAVAAISALQNDQAPDGNPVDDTVYYALSDLRASLNEDIQARGLRLPELVTHTPVVTMPALVIAHQLYGDPSRDAELIERNNLLHPLFVVGGDPLEVLADG